jgi:hypothetical protein
MTTPETPSTPRRRLRYFLISLAAFAVTVALFYAEEDWRGWRAMEKARRILAAQGEDLDWTRKIPAPVPDNENVFGVPEMQEVFTGRGRRGTNYLLQKLHYPGLDSTTRMIVAQLTIGLPGASAPGNSGAAVLQWGDPRAKAEAARLIKDALGPVVMHPAGLVLSLRQPGEIRPAQVFLQCQTAPTEKELLQFLPKPIANTILPDNEKIQVEPAGSGSYNVTILAPSTAAEFLKWNEQLEPDDTLIRNALQRPYARMNGDYTELSEIPIPNFVSVRTISQRLSAMARCHLLLGQPEEALRDLTLMHDICRRILEDNKPMTLVSAMISVAVRGLYASTIADGLRLQAWREPQLAALEGQLEQINLLGPVKQGFEEERFSVCHHLATLTPAQYRKLYDYFESGRPTNSLRAMMKEDLTVWRLIPRGWAWQNMATAANLYTNLFASMDPASQIIFPDKANASQSDCGAAFSHWSPYGSPYAFMASIGIPNFTRGCQRSAENQTMVNQALIACALERYHLAHGEYPETLDALVPQFIETIPHDVIGGQPPHYRRNSDGTFLLYSIGWSQQDHGGHAGGQNDYSQTHSDLVWPEK